MSSADTSLSIGDLSASSGISPHTLRVWERRYGRPTAHRLPSGHRRYSLADADWLRAVHELLAYGHRAGALLALPPSEIATLLGSERQARAVDRRGTEWLEAFRRSGAGELRRRFRAVMDELGPARGVHQVVAVFVEQLGREWEDGRLAIAQEHAVTEILEDLLRGERERIEASRRAEQGPRVLLATLSGERHGLGLQMAALILAANGVAPLLLGVDLPAREIAAAASRAGAAAVGISVSLAHAAPEHGRQVQELRSRLPARVALLIGGLGARAAARGAHDVEILASLGDLGHWAERSRRRTQA